MPRDLRGMLCLKLLMFQLAPLHYIYHPLPSGTEDSMVFVHNEDSIMDEPKCQLGNVRLFLKILVILQHTKHLMRSSMQMWLNCTGLILMKTPTRITWSSLRKTCQLCRRFTGVRGNLTSNGFGQTITIRRPIWKFLATRIDDWASPKPILILMKKSGIVGWFQYHAVEKKSGWPLNGKKSSSNILSKLLGYFITEHKQYAIDRNM